MNDQWDVEGLHKRAFELEQRVDKLESETNENLTMVIGQGWKHGENLRLHRTETSDRLARIDDRIDGLHRDVAELEIEVKAIRQEHGDILKEILALLKKGE